jgi:Flp pilus assembly protein TadG
MTNGAHHSRSNKGVVALWFVLLSPLLGLAVGLFVAWYFSSLMR